MEFIGTIIGIVILYYLVKWVLKPLSQRPETNNSEIAGGDLSETIEKTFVVGHISFSSSEEIEIHSIILRKFFSPVLKTNVTPVEKTKTESDKEKEFESSEAYIYLVNFVGKFGNNYQERDFYNLKKIFESKGFSFDEGELKTYINYENKNQDYLRFKSSMSANFPKTLSEYIKNFVLIYEKKLKLLQDFKRGYDISKKVEFSEEEIARLFKEEGLDMTGIEELLVLENKFPHKAFNFAAEMAIRINFLRRILSENKIELKYNGGRVVNAEELIEMIIDKANEHELKIG